MKFPQLSAPLYRTFMTLGILALLLGLGKPTPVAADRPTTLIVYVLNMSWKVCQNEDYPLSFDVDTSNGKPLGNLTWTITSDGKLLWSESSEYVSSPAEHWDRPYQDTSKVGQRKIIINATSLQADGGTITAEAQITITVIKCKKQNAINYQGAYKLSGGGGGSWLPPLATVPEKVSFTTTRAQAQDFAWQASETLLVDDLVLTPDESGTTFTGSGQLWYTMRVWGSGTYVNCSMSPAIEATAPVTVQARLDNDILDVSTDIKAIPPLTPAITLSCTVLGSGTWSFGPIPTAGTLDPSLLGLDSFSVPASGGMKTSTLSQGMGFTAPGQGTAVDVITNLDQTSSAAQPSGEALSALASPWLESARFGPPALLPDSALLAEGR